MVNQPRDLSPGTSHVGGRGFFPSRFTNLQSQTANGLVHRYFAKLNRFCTQSSIVPWTPPGYTLSSTRRIPLTGSERRTTQRFSMRLPLTVRWTTGAAVGETSTESRDVSSHGVARRRRRRRGCRHRALRIPARRRRKIVLLEK